MRHILKILTRVIHHDRTSRLQLSNLSDSSCTVSFEPLGAQAELPIGELLDVEISGPGDGVVEVSYVPNGIIICEWDGASTVARNQRGELVGH